MKRNLTINLGVRFDHDGPFNEKYGRTVNGFDSTRRTPSRRPPCGLSQKPIAQLPVGASTCSAV